LHTDVSGSDSQSKFDMQVNGSKQVSEAEQYSSSAHEVVARQVDVAWQVRGPPLVISLQDVKPVTVEQSDVTPQTTCWQIFSALHNSSDEHT